ncbi:unnamed protein product [Dibothriocephalus latus]|uniref:BPTI/Kunitz inhibitor domain-containing protein n=1 Tax=Dibothriocephalus latus TaxID=60516 RepID=A0A3P7LIG4_DIBLA|nr:unnamed protein product [Dibothriocephalus latus]
MKDMKYIPLERHFARLLSAKRNTKDLKYAPLQRFVELSPPEETKRSDGGGRGICNLLPDSGMCMAMMPRFYFEASDGTCKSFIYGGCRGNENNFATERECLETCA